MSKTTRSSEDSQLTESWPKILRIQPKTLLIIIGLWLLSAWSLFLAIDIAGWIDPELSRPVWMVLFNDRPVEWTQWLLLAIGAGSTGYLAGRLDSMGRAKQSRFFLLLAIGFGLMLVEDAGDIRHVLNSEIARLTGDEIFGIKRGFIVEAPYFLTLAAVPLYAIARYGKYVWQESNVRLYLFTGFIFYALAAGGSAISNLFHSYVVVGGFVDLVFLGGNLEPLPGRSQGFTYFLFTDSAIEESVELIGLTLILAAILAFISNLRQKKGEKAA